MQITVTGATGHIGCNLVRALVSTHRGPTIRAMARNEHASVKGVDVHLLAGDLRDKSYVESAIQGSDIVYHLAARISIDENDKQEMNEINVDGTMNVINACEKYGVKKVVYFSSVHAFSTSHGENLLDENHELCDQDKGSPAYDVSKAVALRNVRKAAERGLPVVIVHPTGVIGPNDHGPSLMGSAIRDMALRKVPALVDGGFNFVDVRDVVDGAINAEKHGRHGESYLLAGQWISVQNIGQIVAESAGTKPIRATAPMWLARVGVPFAGVYAKLMRTTPLFTSASLHALRTHRNVSHEKAAKELNYRPRPIEQTLRDTVAWMKQAGMLE